MTAEDLKQLARDCGFELAGIAAAEPSSDFQRFDAWRQLGMAGEMNYLTDHPGDKRSDPHTKVLTLHEEEIYRKAAEYKDRIAASIKR